MFAAWLTSHHYRPSTARKTLSEVQHCRASWEQNGKLHLGARQESARRYVTYLAENGGPQDDFDAALCRTLDPSTRQRHGPRTVRKQPARSFCDSDWDKLTEAFALSDEPEGVALYLQSLTSYRIGDVLGIERRKLQAALRSGVLPVVVKGGHTLEVPIDGARDVWESVYARWPAEHATLAAWICPTSKLAGLSGGGAYQRVNRHLKELARELKLDSRCHLHRIRRTVGVRALRDTRDIHAVQQLMGHTTIASTEHYLDELRTDDIAKLQQRLRVRT